MSRKYLFILVSHPYIAGTWLPVYFSGISNFKPPILASWGTIEVDVAIASNVGLALASLIRLLDF